MSSTLVYTVPQSDNNLSDELKIILTRKYKLNQGASALNVDDLAYLQGLCDAGIKDADKLCELVRNNERVLINLEY